MAAVHLGDVFGRLTVEAFYYRVVPYARLKKGWCRSRIAICRCRCGKRTAVYPGSLSNGNTKSCGCYDRETKTSRNLQHGMCRTPEYEAWASMKKRCYNPRSPYYKDYGARGIRVCVRWLEGFEYFYDDMGPRPGNDYSLDRIDNDSDYEPENCRWADRITQSRNRRNNHVLTVNGIAKTITEWGEITGIHRRTITSRLNRGWHPEDAITIPVRKVARV